MDCECKGRNPNCLMCDGSGIRSNGGMFDIDAKSVDSKIGVKNDIFKKTIEKAKRIRLKKIKKPVLKDNSVKPKNETGITLKLVSVKSGIPVFK